jgi:hypothetical protein
VNHETFHKSSVTTYNSCKVSSKQETIYLPSIAATFGQHQPCIKIKVGDKAVGETCSELTLGQATMSSCDGNLDKGLSTPNHVDGLPEVPFPHNQEILPPISCKEILVSAAVPLVAAPIARQSKGKHKIAAKNKKHSHWKNRKKVQSKRSKARLVLKASAKRRVGGGFYVPVVPGAGVGPLSM